MYRYIDLSISIYPYPYPCAYSQLAEFVERPPACPSYTRPRGRMQRGGGSVLRPVRLLRVWISEGLTQANS